MLNLGFVEIRSADVSSQITFHPFAHTALNLNLNYTYQKARDFSSPEDKGVDSGSWDEQIPYIPHHSGSAVLGGIYKSWDMNYSFIYIDEWYHNSYNILANYEQP